MNIELDYISLADKKYPAYCDLRVLSQIQEEFESVNEFERQLLGQKIVYDADGNPERNEDGTIVKESIDSSIRAIVKGLYLMIHEGQRLEGATEFITEDEVYDLQENTILLRMVVHGLFMKCFTSKKNENIKTPRKKKTQN